MNFRTALSLAALALPVAFGCSKANGDTPDAKPAPVVATTPKLAVKADEHGFTPSSVTVKKGQPLTLVFTRTTDETCATKVVFPDLKIEKDLPKDTPVAIEVPTGEARTLTFQCGMGMYKSKVVIQ
jgi:hypothetical protein